MHNDTSASTRVLLEGGQNSLPMQYKILEFLEGHLSLIRTLFAGPKSVLKCVRILGALAPLAT